MQSLLRTVHSASSRSVTCDNPGCEGGLGKNWENLMPAWLVPFMQEKVIFNTLVLVAMKCCVM